METTLFSREENISFWKNLILSIIFFTITPVTLGISLFSLYTLKNMPEKTTENTVNFLTSPQSGVRVYASLPSQIPEVGGQVETADARPEIVKQYLEFYDSPLVSEADLIVQTADKYSIDFRLITAIAQQESNLCKVIPPGSYNCWGWGIHSEGTLGFRSFEEGVDIVSKGLRENYLDKGFSTIDEIMSKYTPSSDGSWAHGVKTFMTEME